jgi:hypothetical protein
MKRSKKGIEISVLVIIIAASIVAFVLFVIVPKIMSSALAD